MQSFDTLPKAKQLERWQNVLRVLKALTPHQRRKHWDMEQWAYKTDCGTVACAAGHCAMDPWFKKRGFSLIELEAYWDSEDTTFDISDVHEFFGEYGADAIFYNDTKRPVSQVIREVSAYIEWLKVVE